MRVKSVKFAMLRVTKQFENDRAECEVELGPKDKVEEAYALAMAYCEYALDARARCEKDRVKERLSREFLKLISTPDGRADFAAFIEEQRVESGCWKESDDDE